MPSLSTDDDREADLRNRVRQLEKELHLSKMHSRMLVEEMIGTEHGERQRIAKLLHDGLQQVLVGTQFFVSALRNSPDEKRRARFLNEIEASVEGSIRMARELSWQLYPPDLECRDLVENLRHLCDSMNRQSSLKTRLLVEGAPVRVSFTEKLVLFEAVREMILNAIKHSKARRATVRVSTLPTDEVELSVSDSGRGFDPRIVTLRSNASSTGLSRIRERIERLDGRFEVSRSSRGGAQFRMILPKPQEAAFAAPLPSHRATAKSATEPYNQGG